MSIEEMEKQVDILIKEIEILIDEASPENSYDFVTLKAIKDFMRMSIDQHKDHIEKIAELEKMLSERIKSDDEELINNEGDYVYEPNE
jgi:hypothetical protein